MTTFAGDFAALAVPELLATFGELVQYRCCGDHAEVTAIVSAEESSEDKSRRDRRDRVRRREVTISTDPELASYGGIAAPSIRGQLTVQGTEYAITGTKAVADGFLTLTIERRESLERSAPDYRRPHVP